MHIANSEALTKRVKRISGQVGAIERALSEGDDCASLLHLIAATRGAINGLLDEVIEEHLREHVARPGLSDAERAGMGGHVEAVGQKRHRTGPIAGGDFTQHRHGGEDDDPHRPAGVVVVPGAQEDMVVGEGVEVAWGRHGLSLIHI